MKRTGKNFALLCVGLVAASCAKELNNEIRNVVVPGEEIIFGAAASFENGDQKTKTEYGEPNTEKGYVPLKWFTTDEIEIACPEAVNAQQATYRVSDEITNGADVNSSSATLMRTSEKGLQWSAEEMHHFYAMYPASSMFSDSERGSIGMGEGGVTGYMPVNQNPLKIVNTEGTELSTGNNDGNSSWIVNPDMRYAYMVAKNAYTTESEGNVTLTFKPIVTALEFDVTCPEIGKQENGEAAIFITALSLHSASNTNICGAFKYQFNQTAGEYDENDGILTDANTGTGYDRITMSMPNDGVKMANGNKLDVTFFLLPTVNFTGGDLKLDIFYTLNGSPFVKTATIGKEIQAKKKYFFSDLVLPAIKTNVKGSSWISAIDDNVYVSQLSIPVAGNAFSKGYLGSNPEYYKEQVIDYEELWNLGVRGFEFCTASNGVIDGTADISSQPFICNATHLAGDNLGQAFSKLVAKMDEEESDGTKPYKNECLIIIFKYVTHGEKNGYADTGFDPQIYCQQVCKFLENYSSRLAVLDANTTVGDIRGKIVALIRPGDDAYMASLGKETTPGIDISSSAVADKVTIIQDWGTCIDRWDRRYNNYAAEGAFKSDGDIVFEDLLWGESKSNSSFTYNSRYNGQNLSNDINYPTESLNLAHTLTIGSNANAGTAYISDQIRVVPQNSSFTSAFYSTLNVSSGIFNKTYRYLWLKWPESMTSKLRMIKDVFDRSTRTKGSSSSSIFIQNLCGFYLTNNLTESLLPYNGSYTSSLTGLSDKEYKLNDAGQGGNYSAHAADFNTAFYNFVIAEEQKGADGIQGPWGLVMMDYIGASASQFTGLDEYASDNTTHANATDASAASTALPRLILMNNFKFPLATKQDPASANYDNEIEDGGNAIDFAN